MYEYAVCEADHLLECCCLQTV